MDDKEKKDFFSKIYKEVYPVLIKTAYCITRNMEAAEDVCQEAFIKLYDRIEIFPTVDDARNWLKRVAKNQAFNHLQHEKVKAHAFEKIIKHEPTYTEDTGEKQLLKKETAEKLKKAIDQLSEKLKTPYEMREFGGMSYKEIAEALNISESNVKIRIFRAREELGKLLPIGELYVS